MRGRIQADVLVSELLPADLEAQVRDFFKDVGADVRVRSLPARRGWVEVQWLVMATIPLQAFVTALAAKAAGDVYSRIVTLVHHLSELGPHQSGEYQPLVLQDPVSRLKVLFDPDLPASAYRQLAALDLSAFKHGPLHYDRVRSVWRSDIDELERVRRPIT